MAEPKTEKRVTVYPCGLNAGRMFSTYGKARNGEPLECTPDEAKELVDAGRATLDPPPAPEAKGGAAEAE
jgi:hypothetical protein